jgi:NTE family protein
LRQIRESVAFAKEKDASLANVMNAPDADIYTIDVSFQALKDRSERDFLNQLPTSFVLSAEAVDRLRAAARRLILDSPDLREALRDAGLRVRE